MIGGVRVAARGAELRLKNIQFQKKLKLSEQTHSDTHAHSRAHVHAPSGTGLNSQSVCVRVRVFPSLKSRQEAAAGTNPEKNQPENEKIFF